MDHSAQIVAVVVPSALLFTGAIVVTSLWMPFKAKLSAIEVLKVYAQKGEEPPPSVLEAVNRINGPAGAPPAQKLSRGEHLAHLAGSLGLSIGAAGIAWWRNAYGDPSSPVVLLAVIVAVFFAAASAARLVSAINAPRDGGR